MTQTWLTLSKRRHEKQLASRNRRNRQGCHARHHWLSVERSRFRRNTHRPAGPRPCVRGRAAGNRLDAWHHSEAPSLLQPSAQPTTPGTARIWSPPPRAGQDPSLRSASQLTFSHGTHGASSTFVLLKPDPVYKRIAAALLRSQWRPGEEWRRHSHEKALACHRGTGHNFCPLHGTQLTHGSAAPRCCQLLRSHKRPARHAPPASARHHCHVAQIGYACVCSQAATRQ